MSHIGFPDRALTARWRRLSDRTLAFLDGVRIFVAAVLFFDTVRSFFMPEVSILGVLVRWPGGRPLPLIDGLLLGAALLIRHPGAAFVLVAHAALVVLNIAEFYMLRHLGLHAAMVSFSLVTLTVIGAALARHLRQRAEVSGRWKITGAILAGPLLLLLHLFLFGATDYARRADAIVVFGAGIRPDGSPSLALEDRVRHGARLYKAGVAPVLILSGGPEEPRAMRRVALEEGVPERAIVADPAGVNTYATLRNLRQKRVVAVSHYYHLARIKLAAGRLGLDCATAPCAMSRRLAKEPYFIARECAAMVSYYLFRG